MHNILPFCYFFFFNDTATTEIYTLSLHDALPICKSPPNDDGVAGLWTIHLRNEPRYRRNLYDRTGHVCGDRKSTRLNSSHGYISYAVFCLKKKKKNNI